MLGKIEHIGIAVVDIEKAILKYEQLLGCKCYKKELVASQNVLTAFFETGGNKVELLQSTTPDGVIAKFIEKNGEGMHHIAFAVLDIFAEMERLKNDGFRLLNETPSHGADNKMICFVHPKDTHGVLTELCMEKI